MNTLINNIIEEIAQMFAEFTGETFGVEVLYIAGASIYLVYLVSLIRSDTLSLKKGDMTKSDIIKKYFPFMIILIIIIMIVIVNKC